MISPIGATKQIKQYLIDSNARITLVWNYDTELHRIKSSLPLSYYHEEFKSIDLEKHAADIVI